jgi:YtkA-like
VIPKTILAGLVLAAAAGSPDVTFARAKDYVFQPVKAEVKKGEGVTIAVRLIRKATRKPVTNAVVTPTRIDMAPDGMAEMASQVTALPTGEPGVYAFKADLSMQGRWLFSVAAKVPGERETVVGKVIFSATQ